MDYWTKHYLNDPQFKALTDLLVGHCMNGDFGEEELLPAAYVASAIIQENKRKGWEPKSHQERHREREEKRFRLLNTSHNTRS